MTTRLIVNLAKKYSINIGSGIIFSDEFRQSCIALAGKLVAIVDSNVLKLHTQIVLKVLSGLDVLILEFPAGENNKTRELKQYLEDRMLVAGCNRDTGIIAIGGGVVSDIAGFIAATYCRGIKVLYVPTTLLAMVDASVGGKTGVNTTYGKNMIGAFYQPEAVFMDIDFLLTLPVMELDNGLAEMLKHALIRSKEQFVNICIQYNKGTSEKWLIEDKVWLVQAISDSIGVKRGIIEQDEMDYGVRKLVNFGHTIGHAIEQLSAYTITHGHAVVVGIWLESYLSMAFGLLSETSFMQIQDSLKMFKFTLNIPWLDDFDGLVRALHLDKKSSAGKINCVIIEDIGIAYKTIALDNDKIRMMLDWYMKETKC